MISNKQNRRRLKSDKPQLSNDREPEVSSDRASSSSAPVAHTLTACVRCRRRKCKCDVGLPRCGPCQRSNEECEYFDAAKGEKVSRTYVVHLQAKVQELETQLDRLENQQQSSPDAEVMIRGAGLVRFKENDESRYLGPSSGIAITRLVMELAKQNTNSTTIKQIIPAVQAQKLKDHSTAESSKPTSKVYPKFSCDAALQLLPTPDLRETLIDRFNQTAQYMLPTLHEPSFRVVVDHVYGGSVDPYESFVFRMVIAISIQKGDPMYAGLADSCYLAALPHLESAIQRMDLGTLQCFALMAQYSLVTPTRTASYWIVGLATRLCQQLGITDEATIAHPRFNPLEVDMRRRLFWIITSMEFGLAHSLGRPSAFGTGPDYINVGFFAAVDDRYITSTGVLPNSPPSIKKLIAIHFFKMRLLQAEIRRKLYLKKRTEPRNDQDPWFVGIEAKLKEWRDTVPQNDEGSGLSETWFEGRLNTMLVLLHRPSPQIPRPSDRSAQIAYKASVFNIEMQREQIKTNSVDLTWIFTQSLFMALNTVLWSLSYTTIREEHSKAEVEKCLWMAREAISQASERWPGVESALELYIYLITACLKVYDQDNGNPLPISSPSNMASPNSLHDIASSPGFSSSSTVISAPSPYYHDYNTNQSPSFAYVTDGDQAVDYLTARSPVRSEQSYSQHEPLQPEQLQPFQNAQAPPPPTQPDFEYANSTPIPTPLDDKSFDPTSYFNVFPSTLPGLLHWSAPGAIPSGAAYAIPRHDPEFYLGAIGEQYSQYWHTPFTAQPQLLSHAEQIELMQNLENDGVASDTQALVNESAGFFRNPTYNF